MSLSSHSFKSLVFFVCVLTMSFVASAFALPSDVEVVISGVKGQEKKNVEVALLLPHGIVRNGQVDQRWLLRFVNQIPDLAEQALQPFGYYHSEIEADLQEMSELYRIAVQVKLGLPVKIRKLELALTGAGADSKQLKEELRVFTLKRGSILNHELYDAGKRALQRKAIDLGYLKAAYKKHLVTVFPEDQAADIQLELDTGELYRFGPVRFEGGLDRFNETFLRRFITFSEGDVFSHDELHFSRINFYKANRFDEVLMTPLVDEAEDQKVPIEVKLTPGAQQRLRPGIGYGTNTGGRVSLNYQNSQVLDRPDLYTFDLLLAEKAQSVTNSYTIPQAGGSDNNLIGTVGFNREDLDSYDTQIIYAELEETYGLGSGKTGSFYLRYSREDSNIGSDDNLISYLLIPGVRYYQRSYDDLLSPKSGYQFRLEARGSYDGPLSDTTMAQILGAGSFMWPLSKRVTLHSRVEAATTFKDDEFSSIPASLRFFVGGDNSVRGYAYKSRGPRDGKNEVIGGESLLVGSLEAEYALNNEWGLAVFFDTGSAFDLTENMTFISGAGVGIRRYTLIGPIKIDLANRVSESHHGLRVHLSVGFDI